MDTADLLEFERLRVALDSLINSSQQVQASVERASSIARALPFKNSSTILGLLRFYVRVISVGGSADFCLSLEWKEISQVRVAESALGPLALQAFVDSRRA